MTQQMGVHALGLEKAQGLILTETFYWDQDDRSRAFAKRFSERNRGIHPTMIHAGVYSAVLHYLKAVDALKSDDGTKVVYSSAAGNLVDGAYGLGMFGDVATELLIHTDSDEGLFAGYSSVEFAAPIQAGDVVDGPHHGQPVPPPQGRAPRVRVPGRDRPAGTAASTAGPATGPLRTDRGR